MAEMNPIAALAARLDATRATTAPRDRLGQEQFLELMVAQLQNQDPFKPLDPSQFLGQLAQFGMVSGIQDMQGSVATLAERLRSSQVLDGATLIGRSVLSPGSEAPLATDGAIRGALEVRPGVSNVEIAVRDRAGQLVRSFTVPARGDLTEFAWDGLTHAGAPAAPGTYSLAAVASVDGRNESVPVLLEARVDSVTIDPRRDELLLNTGRGALSLGAVRRVL